MVHLNHNLIKTIYLYIISLVGLILIINALHNLLNLGLSHLFHLSPTCPTNDPEYKSCLTLSQFETQRQLISGLTNLIIGLPLYLYHWSHAKNQK